MKSDFKAFKNMGLKNFLWLALGAILLMNIAVILQNKSIVAKKKAIADEIARPANIDITIIGDSSCADCANLGNYIEALKKQNVKVASEKTLEAKSAEAQEIIKEFEIKKLPSFVVQGELDKFDIVKNLLGAWGEIKNNGFKFTVPVAPYLDVASNQIKGTVEITMISDKSCSECQDAAIFKQILSRFGMNNFSKETAADKSGAEAKNLIGKYKIAALPTFVLTGEISEYENLEKVLKEVGSFEKDGSYVLRELKATGLAYSDLKTGKIVKPGQQ